MIIVLTLILFTIGLCLAAAVSDFMRLKIPNLFSILMIVAFGITAMLDIIMDLNLFDSLTANLIVGGLTFIVMLGCFFMRVFGGGDAKMISAMSLWMGVAGLPVFLMATTITGAVLAIISIGMRKTKIGQRLLRRLNENEQLQNGWIGAMTREQNVLPYGIAIACGAIFGLRAAGLLP